MKDKDQSAVKNGGVLLVGRKDFFADELWRMKRKYSWAEAWLDIMQSVRFMDTKTRVIDSSGRIRWFGKNEWPVSQSRLSKRWGWNPKTVVKFLEYLVTRGLIESRATSSGTLIILKSTSAIKNGESKSESNPENNSENNSERSNPLPQSSSEESGSAAYGAAYSASSGAEYGQSKEGTEEGTKEKSKNRIKNKGEKADLLFRERCPFNDPAFLEQYDKWIRHAKAKQRGITESTIEEHVEILKSCGTSDIAIKQIKYSLSNGYPGLYPPNQPKSNNNKYAGNELVNDHRNW
jgi:hypothetical protein